MVAVAWTENTVSGLFTTAVGQFLFVSMDSDGRFDLPAGADDDNTIGIVQNKPTIFSGSGANKVGLVAFGGGSKLVVDGNASAITAGDPLSNDAAGKGAVAATGDRIHAIALEDAAADDLIISVLIIRGTMK